MSEMTYRPLGSSGLMVSVVGLGCNAFGTPHRRRRHPRGRATPRSTPASPCSTPPTPTARGRQRGAARRGARVAARRRGAGHQVRHGHGRRERARLGRPRLPPLRPHGGRGQPAPARHRPHRPLPAAPARPGARRSRRPSRRSTSSSPRARCATSAAPTSRPGRSSTRTGPPRAPGLRRFVTAQNEYSLLQPGRRGGAGAGAASASGMSLLPYFPLAYGLLTGKYRRGEAAAGRQPARRGHAGAPAGRAPTGTAWRRSRRSPPSAASASSTWPSAAWPRSRPSAASSPAPPDPSRCTANVALRALGAVRGRPGRARRDQRRPGCPDDPHVVHARLRGVADSSRVI